MGLIRFLVLLLLTPCVVNATCLQSDWLRDRSVLILKGQKGKGSGVILDNNHVLTAWHVVEDLPHIWLRPQGHLLRPSVKATVVKKDMDADVALLKLAKPLKTYATKPIVPLKLSAKLSFSQTVVLTGYRHGDSSQFDNIVGKMKVQNVSVTASETTHSLFKLDKWAYSGHSGGAIFNCKGELAGIETASRVPVGLQDEVVGVHLDVLKKILP